LQPPQLFVSFPATSKIQFITGHDQWQLHVTIPAAGTSKNRQDMPQKTFTTVGAPGGALLQDCQNAFSGRQQGTSRGGIPDEQSHPAHMR